MAQVQLDETHNANNRSIQRQIVNNERLILIPRGKRKAENEFHSFSTFSLSKNDTARFQSSGDIRNIIIRVTGQNSSRINGRIEVLEGASLSNSNLIFLNPYGIKFGANSSLRSNGGFLFSNADRVDFSNGNYFGIRDSRLSSSTASEPLLKLSFNNPLPPSKSGGLLQINGNQSGLQFDNQSINTLAFIGRGVTIRNTTLGNPGGRTELGSLNTGASVTVNTQNPQWEFDYGEALGNRDDISLINRTAILSNESLLAGSQIGIFGKNISLEESSITANQLREFDTGGFIQLDASGLLSLSDSEIDSIGFAFPIFGDSGLTFLQSDNVPISLKAQELRFTDSSISAESFGGRVEGQINSIEFNVTDLFSLQNSIITGDSRSASADAGNILIRAGITNLDNSRITSNTEGGQGNINFEDSSSIQSELIRLNQSSITTNAGNTDGGDINIETFLLIGQNNSDITANSDNQNGGDISISSDIQPLQFTITDTPSDFRSNDIAATSGDVGLDGNIEVGSSINPSLEIAKIPDAVLAARALISTRTCQAANITTPQQQSSFNISLEPSRTIESISSLGEDIPLNNWIPPLTEQAPSIHSSSESFPIQSEIREASQWSLHDGKVVLHEAQTLKPQSTRCNELSSITQQ